MGQLVMLRSPFAEEPVTRLVATLGAVGPLGGKGVTTYTAGATHSALITTMGAEAAVKLGLTATAERFRVRLPAGVVVQPADRLRFRGRDWKVMLVEVRVGFTKVIAEEIR